MAGMTFAPTFTPSTEFGKSLGNLANAFANGPSPLQLDAMRARLNLAKARTQEITSRIEGRRAVADLIRGAPLNLQSRMNEIAATSIQNGVHPMRVAEALRIAAGQTGVTDETRAATHVAAGKPVRPKDRFSLTGPAAPTVDAYPGETDEKRETRRLRNEYIRQGIDLRRKRDARQTEAHGLRKEAHELRKNKATEPRKLTATDKKLATAQAFSALGIVSDGRQYKTYDNGDYVTQDGALVAPGVIDRITNRTKEYMRDGMTAEAAARKAVQDIRKRGGVTEKKDYDPPGMFNSGKRRIEDNPKVPYYERPKATPKRAPTAKTPEPKVRGKVTATDKESAAPLPTNPSGLRRGTRYTLPDGRTGVFDGSKFTDVR